MPDSPVCQHQRGELHSGISVGWPSVSSSAVVNVVMLAGVVATIWNDDWLTLLFPAEHTPHASFAFSCSWIAFLLRRFPTPTDSSRLTRLRFCAGTIRDAAMYSMATYVFKRIMAL